MLSAEEYFVTWLGAEKLGHLDKIRQKKAPT
jgi:hypothetical protein